MFRNCGKSIGLLLIIWMFATPLPALSQTLPLAITVEQASLGVDPASGLSYLEIRLTPDSSKAFATFTDMNVGKQATLSIDGKVVITPTIMGPILDGKLQIRGDLQTTDLHNLATHLVSDTANVEVDLKKN